jgi:hypothetical protein
LQEHAALPTPRIHSVGQCNRSGKSVVAYYDAIEFQRGDERENGSHVRQIFLLAHMVTERPASVANRTYECLAVISRLFVSYEFQAHGG